MFISAWVVAGHITNHQEAGKQWVSVTITVSPTEVSYGPPSPLASTCLQPWEHKPRDINVYEVMEVMIAI